MLTGLVCAVQGVDFQYENLGKAIPPPKDRLPSGGNYKEMQPGVMPQQEEGQEYAAAGAQEYVQDLMDKASQVSCASTPRADRACAGGGRGGGAVNEDGGFPSDRGERKRRQKQFAMIQSS